MALSSASLLKSSLFILFFNIAYTSKDSITLNQSINGFQKLTSNGGKFELGFFIPGTSPYYYLGIWYGLKDIPKQTIVWVANRETPLAEISQTTFAISENGNLVLSNQTDPIIWCTNVTHGTPTVVVAVLLDTGNFVLRDASNPNVTLWQSFDHPTHVWLPGGKIGLNKVTKQLQRLTSWRNEDDPSPGIFNLEIDPYGTNQLFIIWNNSFNFWTSGTWNGQTFSLTSEIVGSVYFFAFNYISNDKENYVTYTPHNYNQVISTMIIMDLSGQIKLLIWVANAGWLQFWSQTRQQCRVHALCGPFGVCNEVSLPFCSCIRGFSKNSRSDWAWGYLGGGCVRNTKLECESTGKGDKDRFYMMSNTRMPDNPITVQAYTASDCESNCLNNCSCTAYTYSYNSGCLIWHGGLLNLQEKYNGFSGGTLFVRLAASEPPVANKSKAVHIIPYVVSCTLAFLTFLIVAWLVCCCLKRSSCKSNIAEGGLTVFRYSELRHATRNFSEKVGGGGFGSVFKGVLPDTSSIAVKQLEGVKQGEKQFRAEVSTVGIIQHVNLVRLRGFCSEGLHKMLVYDYMTNGSLDRKLFNEMSLDWKTRFQIALGTAHALTYLHEHCRNCIVHCDIKPENILLDASFVPKIADFGLAKLVGRDFSRVLTTMRGTIGYLAPEWISGVAITAKADVYSYGMVLFELISGKRNSQKLHGQEMCYFPSLAASKLKEGDVMSLLDWKLEEEEISKEEVVRVCKVACWCIQDEEDSRPSMSQVIQMLEGVMEVSMPPIPRMLQILAENPESVDFYSDFFLSAASSNH